MKHTEYGHSVSFIAQDWDNHPTFTHSNLDDVGNFDSDVIIRPDETKRLHLDKNTWETWGLIPDSRPTMAHPPQSTQVIDAIPGVNGNIDLSLATFRYPIFGNREGEFTFIYNPLFQQLHDKYKPWDVVCSEMMNFIHGRQLRMILEDDPTYYYEGRFSVNSWTSNNDGSGSTVTIGYSVKPYKISIMSSLNDWLWDPFNFYNGVILSNACDIMAERTSFTNIKSEFGNIITNPSLPDADNYWYGKTGEKGTYLNLYGLAGTMPINPIIYWKPNDISDVSGIDLDAEHKAQKRVLIVNYVNYAYDIKYYSGSNPYKYFDPNGSYGSTNSLSSKGVQYLGQSGDYYKFQDLDMIFCDAFMGEYQFIQFIGDGEIKIEYNRGSL